MAITRTQFITVAELNEILRADYADNLETELLINEASELLQYHMFDRLNEYTVLNAPDQLKLATAYQVLYNEDNSDNEYASCSKSVGIGKTSETLNYGGIGTQEHSKIAPKSRRYLIDGGLIRRII